MLAEMREPAFRLGMAFAAEAERAQDVSKKIEFFHLFDRCGFAVRVSIALELRLERTFAVRPEPREPASDREILVDHEDLADRDPPHGYEPEYDRERDRESERASLPILLRALEGVVADATNLPGPPPAELLTLRELLAKVKAGPATARPQARARLAATPAARATRHQASNVGAVLAMRRATGPPPRH
jgi:hypothetical protein